jgi:dihydroorotase
VVPLSAPPGHLLPSVTGSQAFDMVVHGGLVIDSATGKYGRYDVGIIDGLIAAVAPTLPRPPHADTVDAEGCIVVPGLVDLHTHMFFSGTFWGIDPTPIAWRTGVTMWVDAGSAGAYSVEGFRQICSSLAPLRTRAFLHISAIGLVAETGEARRDELCDPELCAAAIEQYRDFIVGVKCRLDRNAVGEMGLEPLRRAIAAAAFVGLPVMAHIGIGPPAIDDVLDMLRPGDILTHCATGQNTSIMDNSGKLRPSAADAHDRGVLFDLGHGSGGFSYAVAEAMLASGLSPDIISSDLHQRSLLGPAFDLPTCMSKMLALGMPVEEVVRAVTVNPARAIGAASQSGSLEIGRRADIATFELEEGDFVLYDTYLEPRHVDRLFINRATLVAGVPLLPVPAAPVYPWVRVTDQQRALMDRSPAELRRPWATMLTGPGAFAVLPIEGPPLIDRRN